MMVFLSESKITRAKRIEGFKCYTVLQGLQGIAIRTKASDFSAALQYFSNLGEWVIVRLLNCSGRLFAITIFVEN